MSRSLSTHTGPPIGSHAAASQAFRFARLASGARIAWTCSGPPRAPMLVRAAHWLTNVEYDLRSPIWAPWVERLSRSFRLVRYDERGCGLSGDDARPRGSNPGSRSSRP